MYNVIIHLKPSAKAKEKIKQIREKTGCKECALCWDKSGCAGDDAAEILSIESENL